MVIINKPYFLLKKWIINKRKVFKYITIYHFLQKKLVLPIINKIKTVFL